MKSLFIQLSDDVLYKIKYKIVLYLIVKKKYKFDPLWFRVTYYNYYNYYWARAH